MPQTVASNAASLCPVGEFLKRVDARTVGQLASDTTTVVAPGSLATNDNVLAALYDASGIVESAALRGGKYTAADLAALRDEENSNVPVMGANLLYRIVSDVAWVFLWERRPNKSANQDPPPSYERSLAWLDELANGTKIFPMQEAMDAGRTETQVETRADVEDRNGMVYQASRYFGVRGSRGGR